ncbi:MAG: Uma2 family endonuclease [Pyrinomonadaceae bacterium]|nr:Uma2 family endonuclease [Pyrinomonadaceae bacterium]
MQTVSDKSYSKMFIPNNSGTLRFKFEENNKPFEFTDDEFWDFCRQNDDLRIEMTKEGDVIIMPPTGANTGERNSEINFQLKLWAKKDKSGKTYDSSTGFKLPNGAIVSPDASWVLAERLEKFTAEQRERFLHLSPDFVVELRSASESLKVTQNKMSEYIENGARLGWLIDPKYKKVHIYRAGGEVEILENPKIVSGEDVLQGFMLDLTEIW